MRVRGAPEVKRGCPGRWLSLHPTGFICKDEAVTVAATAPALRQILPPVDRTRDVPFEYVRVTSRKAYRFRRIPSPAARAALLAGERNARDLAARPLEGTYFLALTEPLAQAAPWAETLEGNFVHQEVLAPLERSKLSGAPLGKQVTLPLAFTYDRATPVYQRDTEGTLTPAHAARRYARVTLRDLPPPGAPYVETRDGYWLAREDIRLVSRAERPQEVPEGALWIDVDLSEQTLTLYQGDTPVYATLVSTGVEGRATPTGLFQLKYKHLSTTMRGTDEAGPYEVQEVPWAMFYDAPYAIHGAYWHDNFGQKQSHGCTNLAPRDARWLFANTSPETPEGWHLAIDKGTWIRFRS